MVKTATKNEKMTIQEVTRARLEVHILGTSPLICNRMSQKAMQELLLPKGAKARRSGMKHNPVDEFRASPYTSNDPDSPTLLQALAAWFKAAMVGATVDMPHASKAGVGRNVWVTGERVALYGRPKMMMAVVRSAGMNKTPDVRTRAVLPEWACSLTIEYARPQLTDKAVASLLATAGVVMGVGDWRPEKGSGNYGQFQLVNASSKDWKRVAKIGRDSQVEALDAPEPYDDETETMLEWFTGELNERGLVQ